MHKLINTVHFHMQSQLMCAFACIHPLTLVKSCLNLSEKRNSLSYVNETGHPGFWMEFLPKQPLVA